jgi:hypothetical protein
MHQIQSTNPTCCYGGIGKILPEYLQPLRMKCRKIFERLLFVSRQTFIHEVNMKTAAVVLLCVFNIAMVSAQEQVLVSGEVESGGFGGPVVKLTSINGENALMVGGRGGWLINHSFVIGGAGYGLVTDVNAKVVDSVHQYLDMGYGGLDLEYIASSNELLHLSIGLLIGGGGVGYRNENSDSFNTHHQMKGFFVLEPSAHVNLNVTHFFRIAAGVSYRYVNGLNSTLSTNADLSGPSAMLTFKFGKF